MTPERVLAALRGPAPETANEGGQADG